MDASRGRIDGNYSYSESPEMNGQSPNTDPLLIAPLSCWKATSSTQLQPSSKYRPATYLDLPKSDFVTFESSQNSVSTGTSHKTETVVLRWNKIKTKPESDICPNLNFHRRLCHLHSFAGPLFNLSHSLTVADARGMRPAACNQLILLATEP